MSLGCWKDDGKERAIPTLENVSTILDGDWWTREYAIEKCAAAAESFGYEVFSVQGDGWCASSENALDTYDKYGESSNCFLNGKGGDFTSDVYQLRKGKLLLCIHLTFHISGKKIFLYH